MKTDRTCTIVVIALALAYAPAGTGAEPAKYDAILQKLNLREIGPAITGGRIDDVAVVESDPSIVFIATASGGIWKTINSGITWEPVFDKESVSTIGTIRVALSDPSIVWAGTGEANNRQSSSWGDGVYKSTDGGRTWANMGLRDSQHIGRLAIHPRDPNIVYVAAAGRLWGPNKERGVFKTTDGGKTWTHSLFIDEDTGAIDIAMDPQSPDTVYAAAYTRRRTVFGFAGGGPRAGIYRTKDGGTNWTKLTKGLPEGETGRIALQIYRKNPNIVYALVENSQGGVFRSEDKGETWTRMSDLNPRPMYFSKIHIDPGNDLRIWVLGKRLYYSEDGGRTFRDDIRAVQLHSDFHGLWINPANSDHMIIGYDAGMAWSYDGGRMWEYMNNMPLGQFYELGFDMGKPYRVCGGLQDTGLWCGPSATWYYQGITNEDWFLVGTNDGQYIQIDPTDPHTVYMGWESGTLMRRYLRANEARSIRPMPAEGEAPYRIQWVPPLMMSPHDPKTLYYGAQFLFKSTDRGDSWTKVSGDLTTGVDRGKLPIMGKVPDRNTLSGQDGVAFYPCLTTISESPIRAGLIWVGADDGSLQVTHDGGKSWTDLRDKVPGVPKGTYVSRVVASRHAEGTAYVTFDGHRSNDFNIYIFTTTDYGQTWKPISDGIQSNNDIIHVIREHFRNPNLLFAGTERAAYVSFDRGAHWHKITSNFPTVPVDDIEIHPRENDLILGTHGRSIWILDDITPLEQLNDEVLSSDLHLFDMRPATAWRIYANRSYRGNKEYTAPNPPYGAIISYYLKSHVSGKENVKITVLDSGGNVVREMDGPAEAGLNRVNWDLRYTPLRKPTADDLLRIAAGTGSFGPRGPLVDPGEYTVKVALGEGFVSKTVTVEEDPRVTISAGDRRARRDVLNRLYELDKTGLEHQKTLAGVSRSFTNLMTSWKRPGGPQIPDNVLTAADVFGRQLREVQARFSAGVQRASALTIEIDGYTAAPTARQKELVESTAKSLAETAVRLHKLTGEDLPNLNKMISQAGVPALL